MSEISCVDCHTELPDAVPGTANEPCPHCGSTVRSYAMKLSDDVNFQDGHRAKGKNPALPSAKKLRFDTYSGIEHSHKYGKLVRVVRTIDKDNDLYREQVIDLETAEVLHECQEPLSKHVGHGTAKSRCEP